ncbi:MAG TPA: hypothetical protein VIK39_07580 [Candidatus Angelobacter sp.]
MSETIILGLAEGVGVGDGAEEKELWPELQPTTKMVSTTKTAPAQGCTNLWFIAYPTVVPNHHIFQQAVFARLLAQKAAVPFLSVTKASSDSMVDGLVCVNPDDDKPHLDSFWTILNLLDYCGIFLTVSNSAIRFSVCELFDRACVCVVAR